MDTSASAGVEFLGSSMRYSEIELSGDDYRLLRLGDCEFEFDAQEVLFGAGPDVYLETISDAIAEVFEDSSARVFRVIVHPPASKQFMSSVSVNSSESSLSEQFVFEAALLDVDRDVVALTSIAGVTVPAETRVGTRSHVSHISTPVNDRIERVLGDLAPRNVEPRSSIDAILKVLKELFTQDGESGKRELVVGIYKSYSIYLLMCDGACSFSQQRSEVEGQDVLYFSLQALRLSDVPVSELGSVKLFGSGDLESFSTLFEMVSGKSVQKLNPMSTVNIRGNAFEKDFTHSSFAMCIGAAL